MSTEKKWKSSLVSSGLPLEFEAAKILVSKGFSVQSDFTYARSSSGEVKDFSVDIKATASTPFSDPNKMTSQLILLVESKFRRDTNWLFVPDPNEPDVSPVTLGHTLRIVDQFSPYLLSRDPSVRFDCELRACYKGTEIKENRDVYDSGIREGIAQLRYALPRLISENVLFRLESDLRGNIPFVFCPILLTTAQLHIMHMETSMRVVESMSEIQQMAVRVPYVLLYADYGPEFERHCSIECQSLRDLDKFNNVRTLEGLRRKSAEHIYKPAYPSLIGNSLAKAERYQLVEYFTQFVVCTYVEFDKLIDTIKRTVEEIAGTRKRL